MNARRPLSTQARVALFRDHGGICHICGGLIMAGQAWEAEHVIPLAQGGSDDADNLRPAHFTCHRAKTVKDATDTARARRREARHIGAAAPSRTPLPGGKRSPWKRKINGEVVRRGER